MTAATARTSSVRNRERCAPELQNLQGGSHAHRLNDTATELSSRFASHVRSQGGSHAHRLKSHTTGSEGSRSWDLATGSHAERLTSPVAVLPPTPERPNVTS